MKGICKANNKYSQYLIDIFVEYVVKTELSEYKMTVDWTDVYVLINYDTTEWQSFFFFTNLPVLLNRYRISEFTDMLPIMKVSNFSQGDVK